MHKINKDQATVILSDLLFILLVAVVGRKLPLGTIILAACALVLATVGVYMPRRSAERPLFRLLYYGCIGCAIAALVVLIAA